MGRKRTNKQTIFMVIDILHIENSIVCRTISDVSDAINVDRRTIDLSKEIIYKHHLVLMRDV